MGQYHKPVNITKKEWFNPHALGDGLKALEQTSGGAGGVASSLHLLLMGFNRRRGGGDYPDGHNEDVLPSNIIGRWAGDIVFMAGDYAAEGDLDLEFPAHMAYSLCVPPGEDLEDYVSEEHLELAREIGPFTDITPLLKMYFTNHLQVRYGRTNGIITRN